MGPNLKIFPLPYISIKKYAELEPSIKKLAAANKTLIKYDFVDQFFEIKGDSQQACDNTSKTIERDLLPRLTSLTVDDYKFKGTFEDFESILSSANVSPSVSASAGALSPVSNSKETRMTGRPLDLGKLDEIDSAESTAQLAPQSAFSYAETESDGPDTDDDVRICETFKFSKNIRNPMDVLTGPLVNNTKADYLRIIGNDTDTECSLDGRQVKIVGTSSMAVGEALQRFQNLQKIFKRTRKSTQYVACVHYPTAAPEFVLYFCDLERYAQKEFVDVLEKPSSPLYVILPVFKDASGDLAKPTDLCDPPRQNLTQQRVQKQQTPQESTLSLDERMRMASLEHKKNAFGNANAGMAPDHQPLWGENKKYVVRPSSQPPYRAEPPTSRNDAPRPPMCREPADDFPALPTAAPRVAPKKTTTRRVMRLTNQKASPAVVSPINQSFSVMENLRTYNFHNIKTALEDGLDGVRGFKGDVKLSAKIGKVLWNQISPDVQKKFWSYTDLNDRLMKNDGVKPAFNSVTTKFDDIIDRMTTGTFGAHSPPYSGRVSFEIYAKARNQPGLPYQPVVMHMKNQGVVELTKIVTATNKVTEIEWVSLDRKYDFQFLLQTEEMTRMDVKPFNTFIKKVAVNPETRHITFNNVPDFLEVNYILSKQTSIYRLIFPFVAEITRVERVPLVRQSDLNGYEKIFGDTGKGQVWFEFEVFNTQYGTFFKENQNLQAGKFASWTSESIIEGTDKAKLLVDYICCLLTMIERFEDALR